MTQERFVFEDSSGEPLLVPLTSAGRIPVEIVSTVVNLDDIGDVTAPTPADNDLLQFNTGTSQWENQTVATVLGDGSIGNLGDVVLTAPANTHLLQFNGSDWVNVTPAAMAASIALDDLSDVAAAAPATNDLLQFDGINWVNQTRSALGLVFSDLADGDDSGRAADEVLVFDGINWVSTDLLTLGASSIRLGDPASIQGALLGLENHNSGTTRGSIVLYPNGNAGSPYTAAPPRPGILQWDSIYENNFTNNSLGGALNLVGTYRQSQNGFAFNNGLVFNHATTYENNAGAAANFGPIFTLVDQPLIRSTGGARTMSIQNSVRAQPRFGPHTGGGTLSVTTVTLFETTGTVETGSTVSNWTCFRAGNRATMNGTITTMVGLDIDTFNQGGTNIGIRSNMTSAAGDFINHSGTARAVFGGEVEVDGAFNHDGSTFGIFGTAPAAQPPAYTPTNVTTDRSYDANATTLDEVADVLGTLIADLQSLGIIG